MLVYHEQLSGYYEPGFYAWDTLPDSWQRYYFGENNPEGLQLVDPDGDGQNNAMECLAGTDPTDDSSRDYILHRGIGQRMSVLVG